MSQRAGLRLTNGIWIGASPWLEQPFGHVGVVIGNELHFGVDYRVIEADPDEFSEPLQRLNQWQVTQTVTMSGLRDGT